MAEEGGERIGGEAKGLEAGGRRGGFHSALEAFKGRVGSGGSTRTSVKPFPVDEGTDIDF